MSPLPLPLDGHVHSQWSWDAVGGDMQRTCARAVEIGLDALAFTEHADFTRWSLHSTPPPGAGRGAREAGTFVPAPLDVAGYLHCLDRCRSLFPQLRILSGLELGEPHLHPSEVHALVASGEFDRVLGSLHSLPDLAAPAGSRAWVEVGVAYGQREPLELVRAYLQELETLIAADPPVAVLAHIDYPLRHWPAAEAPAFARLEAEVRSVLTRLAGTGRALEVNTRVPLAPMVVEWWHECGGDAVAFGSDAHSPDRLAWELADTAAMVAERGFSPGGEADRLWRRR